MRTNSIGFLILLTLAACSGCSRSSHHHSQVNSEAVIQAELEARSECGGETVDFLETFQPQYDALAPTGGSIYIPGRREAYVIHETVIFYKPVRLVGDGVFTCIRAARPELHAIFMVREEARSSAFENFLLIGSNDGSQGTLQRGIYLNGVSDCVVKNVIFSGCPDGGLDFGVDILGPAGDNSVLDCRFERLISTGNSGSAVIVEFSSGNIIRGNRIDGTELINEDGSPGGAIFLSASLRGPGSTRNLVSGNRILHHPQVGISINDTTYVEFIGVLGACNDNIIEENEIIECASPRGGDASSGIVIVGNSSFNVVRANRVKSSGHPDSGGNGIVITGSKQGTQEPGQPKMDEVPVGNQVLNNIIEDSQDHGLVIRGAVQTGVIGNEISGSGMRQTGLYSSVYIQHVGGAATADSSTIANNILNSGEALHQIYIGEEVEGTVVKENSLGACVGSPIEDLGTETQHE